MMKYLEEPVSEPSACKPLSLMGWELEIEEDVQRTWGMVAVSLSALAWGMSFLLF